MSYTAPDALALDMGFVLPAGTDLIRDGDNAIKTNAKTAAGAFTAALRTVEDLGATLEVLPEGATPSISISGTIPNKVINFGIPQGTAGKAGPPGMGYEEGQQLLTQNAQTLAAAETAATDAATAIRDNLAADINTPGTPAYDAIVDVAGNIAEPAINAVIGRILIDATAHGIVGDGATNNSATLNTLIQSVSTAGGGTIVLPVGTYVCIGGVHGADNVTIRGASRDGTIIQKSGNNSTWLNTGTDVTGFRLENLTIDGNLGVTTRGLTFSAGSSDCTLAGVTVRNMPAFALDTMDGAAEVTITDCLFVDCNIGVRVSGAVSNVTVARNVFRDWQDSAVFVSGSASSAARDVTITDNTVHPHKAGTPADKVRQPIRFHGHDDNHHRNIIIRNNTVTGTYVNHADTLAPGSADLISIHRTTGFEISGNTVRGGGDVGLTIAQGCRHGRVFANLAEDNDTVGLCLGSAGSAVNVYDVIVTGNTFRDNALDHADTGGQDIPRAVERAKANVLAVQATDCIIDGNVMEFSPDHPRATRYAITWRQCTDVHIGAIGAGNKSTGHTAPYFEDTPASTGMTTTTRAPLTVDAAAPVLYSTTLDVPVSGSHSGTASLSFPSGLFTATPAITVTARTQLYVASVSAPSASGVSITVRHIDNESSNASVEVAVIAVQGAS